MSWPSSPDLLAPLAPWFDSARRDMPWRARDLDSPHPDPYAVLVSELMLQQTQVATVIPYFAKWMAAFPTADDLAAAAEDTVHKAWEGLGYYRRARFLRAAAGTVAAEGWPVDLDGLARLPGLGPYTAAALGAIAFQWPTPALDGNAFRVLARLLLVEGDPKIRARELRTWLAPGLAAHGPSRLTQALMELGATCCAPTPDCSRCPLAARCGAALAGRAGEIPPPVRRRAPKRTALWLVALEAQGRFLLHAPAGRGLLAGLWRWPALDLEAFPSSPQGPVPWSAWPGWTQVYTHRREAVTPLRVRIPAAFAPGSGFQWVAEPALEALPMGRRDQRLRTLLATPGQPSREGPDLRAILRACGAPSA